MTDPAASRRLVLLRHAKSEWPDGVPDHERPLTGRGRRDAAAVGRWLAARVGRVDAVACSTAARTRETWALVAAELADPPAPEFADALYGAPPDAILGVVRDLPDDAATALVVGHNPGIQEVVGLLSGEEVGMRTATVAVLGWTGRWSDVTAGIAAVEQQETPRG